jgi:hypothetical protein
MNIIKSLVINITSFVPFNLQFVDLNKKQRFQLSTLLLQLLERLVQKEINLQKREMKNSINRQERYILITRVEILRWILHVIQRIE